MKIIIFLSSKLKKKGTRKKRKILNLCKYDPAIYSSPKGPDSLCGVLKLPNKSLP